MPPELSGKDLVVLSGDFGRHPSSIEHLVRRFLPGNRVIWVETVGMRRPTWSRHDLRRALGKIVRLGRRLVGKPPASAAPPEGMSVLAPLMLPFHDLPLVRRLNDWSVARAIRREVASRGFASFGVLATVPVVSGIVDRIGAAFSIYYCPDDWASWPGLLNAAISGWERELVRKSRLVIATSEALARRKAALGCPVVLLPHGADVSHFGKVGEKAARVPPRTLALFGLFDVRFDQELLARLAAAHPELTIEVIGPVRADVRGLAAYANIRFTGPVPYADLPAALSSADVLLLPYRRDLLTESVNPLKARECLATGRPVVAMALPEIERLPGVFLARSADEFLAVVDRLVRGELKPDTARAAAALAGASWEERAGELGRHLRMCFRVALVVPLLGAVALWSPQARSQQWDGDGGDAQQHMEQAARRNEMLRRQEELQRQQDYEKREQEGEALKRAQQRRRIENQRREEVRDQELQIRRQRLARRQQKLEIEERELAGEQRKLDMQARERGQLRRVERLVRQNEDLAEQRRVDAQMRRRKASRQFESGQRERRKDAAAGGPGAVGGSR